MTRTFLDSNVVFSLALSRTTATATYQIVRVAQERADDVSLVVTRYVLAETERNLLRKVPAAVPNLVVLAAALEIADEPPLDLIAGLAPLLPDPDDAPILAGAVHSRSDLLVTGNARHFGHLYGVRVRGTLVVPVRDALAILVGG